MNRYVEMKITADDSELMGSFNQIRDCFRDLLYAMEAPIHLEPNTHNDKRIEVIPIEL